jgi:hypothetical protein
MIYLLDIIVKKKAAVTIGVHQVLSFTAVPDLDELEVRASCHVREGTSLAASSACTETSSCPLLDAQMDGVLAALVAAVAA